MPGTPYQRKNSISSLNGISRDYERNPIERRTVESVYAKNFCVPFAMTCNFSLKAMTTCQKHFHLYPISVILVYSRIERGSQGLFGEVAEKLGVADSLRQFDGNSLGTRTPPFFLSLRFGCRFLLIWVALILS